MNGGSGGSGEDVTLDGDRNMGPDVDLDVRGAAQRGGTR